jgi:uncharacterized membrane protein YccC
VNEAVAKKTDFFTRYDAELKHALRVAIAVGVSFAIADVLNLPQGYWAVITAVLVVQTSIGGTLGASRDRLLGTVVGAVVGGIAAFVRPETPLGEGLALVICTAILMVPAVLYPSLRIAPVTAVIMIVGSPSHEGSLLAAGYRVAEIAIGSVIGLAVTLLVFPPRALDLVSSKSQAILEDIANLFRLYAERLEGAEIDESISDLHAKIRNAMAPLEAAIKEASRENIVRLSSRAPPKPVARTFWRVRNDAVIIGRALDRPWPAKIAAALTAPAAALLRAEADRMHAMAEGLRLRREGGMPPVDTEVEAFRHAFQRLEDARVSKTASFEAMSQVFGLSHGFDGLNRNLTDLGARLDELVLGRRD